MDSSLLCTALGPALGLALGLAGTNGFDPEAFVAAHHAADVALVAGELDAARSGFEHCLALSRSNATATYALACVAARAGSADEALEHLAQAVERGYADAAVARWDADLASLRGTPEFEAQLARMAERAEGRVASRELERVTRAGATRLGPVAIDPAGRLVAHGLQDGRSLLLDAATGAEVRRWEALPDALWTLAFHPDGQLLAGLAHDGSAGVFDVETGAARFVARELTGGKYRYPFGGLVAFDPSGERLLVAAADRGAVLWSTGGALLARIERPLGDFFGVPAAWSPDGARIATLDAGKVVFLDGRTARRVGELALSDPASSVAWSPDGERLAVGVAEPPRALVVELATGEVLESHPVRDWLLEDKRVPVVRFSPDGALLAYSSVDGVVVMLDRVGDDRELWTSDFLGGRMGEHVDVRFAPEGSRLYYAWTSGGAPLGEVVFETGKLVRHAHGTRVPEIAGTGAAVAVTFGGIARFDANTGAFLWHRVELSDEGHVLQAPAGYLSGARAADAGLNQVVEGEELAVRDHVEAWFDPKRVRAAIAGVPLLPMRE